MKTHKVTIYNSQGAIAYVCTGSLERCYNYMIEKAIEIASPNCPTHSIRGEGYTWELTYDN